MLLREGRVNRFVTINDVGRESHENSDVTLKMANVLKYFINYKMFILTCSKNKDVR